MLAEFDGDGVNDQTLEGRKFGCHGRFRGDYHRSFRVVRVVILEEGLVVDKLEMVGLVVDFGHGDGFRGEVKGGVGGRLGGEAWVVAVTLEVEKETVLVEAVEQVVALKKAMGMVDV